MVKPNKSHEILSRTEFRKQSEGKSTRVARVCARKDQRWSELSMTKCQTFKTKILHCSKTRVGIVEFAKALARKLTRRPLFFIALILSFYGKEKSQKKN